MYFRRHNSLAKPKNLWSAISPSKETLKGKFVLVARVKNTAGAVHLLFPTEHYPAAISDKAENVLQLSDGKAACFNAIPEWGRLFICSVNEEQGLHSVCSLYIVRGRHSVRDTWQKNGRRALQHFGQDGDRISEVLGRVTYFSETICKGVWLEEQRSRPIACRPGDNPDDEIKCILGETNICRSHKAQPCVLFTENDPAVIFKAGTEVLHVTKAAKALFAPDF